MFGRCACRNLNELEYIIIETIYLVKCCMRNLTGKWIICEDGIQNGQNQHTSSSEKEKEEEEKETTTKWNEITFTRWHIKRQIKNEKDQPVLLSSPVQLIRSMNRNYYYVHRVSFSRQFAISFFFFHSVIVCQEKCALIMKIIVVTATFLTFCDKSKEFLSIMSLLRKKKPIYLKAAA